MSQQLFSTREIALALGSSESSVRRWCDTGKLRSVKTAGGHRKVPLEAVMQFVRSTGHRVDREDVLGIACGLRSQDLRAIVPDLVTALIKDDQELCHRMITSSYAEGKSLSRIFDDLVGPAMTEVGRLWQAGEIGVDQERRCCRIVLHGLNQLESCLAAPKSQAPQAVGSSPEQDFSELGTKMAELTLRDSGWQVYQVGAGVPLGSLVDACQRIQASLLWLSVIHLHDVDYFVREYQQHVEPLIGKGLSVVVGGRALTPDLLSRIHYTYHGRTMRQLEIFCQGAPRPPRHLPLSHMGLASEASSQVLH